MPLRTCACGCGEFLAPDAVRDYKRGHRKAMEERGDSPVVQEMDDDSPGNGDEPWDVLNSITLEDAAGMVPDDPEPSERAKTSTPGIRITKKIRDDVEGKIAFMLSVTASMAAMIDPVCGGALVENSPDMAAKLTPIICKSPEAVQWFRKSSNFMLYLDFVVACWPVFGAIYAHHMAKVIPFTPNGTMPPMPDMTEYTAA